MASDDPKRNRAISRGRHLASPAPGDEVVISGIAGRFPDSDDMEDLARKLYAGVDLVSDDNRRWKHFHPEIPKRAGKVNLVEKFDAGFLGVHWRQATNMDPMCRMALERVVEAIVDAGVNPVELEGTDTGVFVGASVSDAEKSLLYDKKQPDSKVITGALRSMISHRISYLLKLQSLSLIADTACSSSLTALQHAYEAIRSGECSAAIVVATHLCLHPMITLQFARLGVLSLDGVCKTFDNAANGYVRGEAVCAVLLQKAKDCRRMYAQVVHSKNNCDGYKSEGITYPSSVIQQQLLRDFYDECRVDPASLTYLEAHGTGTRVGDYEELATIDAVFCKGRESPLPVGSVKTNMGHTEPASGLCSVAKIIIAMERGEIPPNLYYKTPRDDAEAVKSGRLQVLVKTTPWPRRPVLVASNNFGFGGGNSHVLLRWNCKEKVQRGLPRDDLPRLVCASGRTEEAVEAIFDGLKRGALDAELVRLYQEVFKLDIPTHIYRGFAVISKAGEVARSLVYTGGEKTPLVFAFGGCDRGWLAASRSLLTLPLFSTALQTVGKAFETHNINIAGLGAKASSQIDLVDEVLEHIVVQLTMVEVLKSLGVGPDFVSGRSVGIFASAYCDGALSLEQAAISGYYAALWSREGQEAAADQAVDEKLIAKLRQLIQKPKRWRIALGATGDASAEALFKGLKDGGCVQSLADGTVLEFGTTRYGGGAGRTLRIDEKADGFQGFIEVLGRLYMCGHNPRPELLYPEVQYPVSRGTPMISPTIKWDHSRDWHMVTYKIEAPNLRGVAATAVRLKDEEWSYLAGHVIDGRNLFPATGYLYLAWEALAQMSNSQRCATKVVFEDVKFTRATNIPKDGILELVVALQKCGGRFEVVEGDVAVVSGRVAVLGGKDEVPNLATPPGCGRERLQPLRHKDIYKELRLRGYNYSGLFKSVVGCDNTATNGLIRWADNWVAFMDNMLQMQILQLDSRLLYVPTAIQRMTIDPQAHEGVLAKLGEEPKVPVHVHKDSKIIRAGGVEIRGLAASSIARRRPLGEPVLERYQFVANAAALALAQSIRVNMQLLLENNPGVKVRAVEVIDEETPQGLEPLGPIVHQVLGDQPLIQPEIAILTKRAMAVDNAKVEDGKLTSESGCSVVVVAKAFARPQLLKEAFGALKPGGLVLSREARDFEEAAFDGGEIQVLTAHALPGEKLIAFRKSSDQPPAAMVDVGADGFAWLPLLQEAMRSAARVVAYAQRRPLCGIVGLINCVRREPGGDKVQCVFVLDESAPPFDLRADFYAKQLRRNLAVNVFKDGEWGTYRHLLLDELPLVESEHCYVNVTVRGDLSSLRWIEGPLTTKSAMEPGKSLVNIYYSAMNFRDVMTATGRINADVITMDRTAQECVQGFEFSGKDQSGKRVMGMVSSGAMATLLAADMFLLWDVPDNWSLEDAATVPIVYGTVLYAFFVRGGLRRGQSVLIHAGSGGVGQAAIGVCLHHGCEVFTTVGTNEKRDLVKRRFPQIEDSHIGNSRDTTFEQMVYEQTKGRGVDFVLNSLSEEKLQASVRCLARGGNFLEIGKFDLASDNTIGLQLFAKEASFHGVMLDVIMESSPIIKKEIGDLLVEGIGNGSVKPLPRTVFAMEKVEEAFRYMGAGKHTGKVLVKVRDEEPDRSAVPTPLKIEGIPRYFCNPKMCHVIAGGLGGFGLELADWLVLRGCRNLLLTSRSGVKNGYQDARIRTWKSYGTSVEISTADITTRKGCHQVIDEANALGPVEAIFNLAVVLQDSILENQSAEKYATSFGPKAFATEHLDVVSRASCPRLRDFVVFSSVSCGRGNAGQTNYGMANSVMERICEKRKAEGFPALAIEWGAVGEVGLVAEMQDEDKELEIGGTLQQKISSCLKTMDVFLRQGHPVVSSIVVAEKRGVFSGSDSVVEWVANIVGVRDLKTISLHSTLAELGMDSMMAVEIKQSLEREFEIYLTPQDIRNMTFTRLLEIQAERQEKADGGGKPEAFEEGARLLFRYIAPEDAADVPVVRLATSIGKEDPAPRVFFVPGIEGFSGIFEGLAAKLRAHAFCLQLRYKDHKDSLREMALELLPHFEKHHGDADDFLIVAHSFGCAVTLELASLLEQRGKRGRVVLVDGSPEMSKRLLQQQLKAESEPEFETNLLCAVMSLYSPAATVSKLRDALLKRPNFQERLQLVLDNAPANTTHSLEYQKDLAVGCYKRLKAVNEYNPTFAKLKSKVALFKPTLRSVADVAEDYGLSGYADADVVVKTFDGDHVTVLDDAKLAEELNALVETAFVEGKAEWKTRA